MRITSVMGKRNYCWAGVACHDLSDDCAVNDASTLESQAVVKVKTDEGRMSKQPDSSNRYLNIDASGVLHDSWGD